MKKNPEVDSKLDAYYLRVPFVLIRSVGLRAAAFVALCEYFSLRMPNQNGWFYFPQVGCGNSSGGMFSLGSFYGVLGFGKDVQLKLRRLLKKKGVLSDRFQESDTAFLNEHRKGIPPNIYYRLDKERYFKFLEDEGVRLSVQRPSMRQKSKPDVLNSED